ncbi:MAG: MBOAT family protein [Oscillospiraceae bacterium]|nr:MBOAT family protein [Oscillospiraceae bacterium]
MSLTSPGFLILLAAAAAVYYLAPKKLRWIVLLAAGLAFYCVGGGLAVLYVLFTALVVYVCGLALGRLNEKRRADGDRRLAARRWCVAAACLLNFGLLFFLKYWNFTAQLLSPLLGGRDLGVSGLLMPLGVSFFMFQSVGYVVDVYRDKVAPERNPLKLLLFVSFFPQMVQGPISRFGELAPQLLAERRFDADHVKYGLQQMMWGYMKKLIIADRAAVLVNTVMGDPWSHGGAVQALGVLFYCVQLYCDFSGGIDIAVGAARLFGIELAANFKRPLFSVSLADFWRRWHITLGAWMRDYVFYPISLSKPFARLGKAARRRFPGKLGKVIPTSLATFIVYLIIGVWHGANFRYIAFGFWNGAIITLSILLAPAFESWKSRLGVRETGPWRAFRMAHTAVIVFFGRYITRAPRLLTALWMVKELFVHPRFQELGAVGELGLGAGDLLIVAAGVLILVLVELFEEKRGDIRLWLEKRPPLIQWLAIALPLLAILCLGILRGSHISSDFIYKQF